MTEKNGNFEHKCEASGSEAYISAGSDACIGSGSGVWIGHGSGSGIIVVGSGMSYDNGNKGGSGHRAVYLAYGLDLI